MDQAYVNDESAASGQPTRCLLFANPDESRITNQRALEERAARAFAEQPVLAIDVGNDALSVIDPASNAVITSAGLAQVTATPGIYAPIAQWSEGSSKEYKQPVLLLEVPGAQNLRIGILPMRFSIWNGEHFRYAWRGKARARLDSKLRTTHVVTETEWFSLLEKFGLAALVVDEHTSGKLDRRERFSKVYVLVFGTLFFIASTVFLVWVFMHSTGLLHWGRR